MTANSHLSRRLLPALGIASLFGITALTVSTGRLHGQSCSGANAIVCENQLPGAPQSEWDVAGAGDLTLQGFATEFSVNRGEVVRFKVGTTAASFNIDVYRLGYYGGSGARKVATLPPAAGQQQPACLTETSSGLVDCGNWVESASWQVPATAVSGIYLARLSRSDTGGASHIVFIVRDDAGAADVLVQASDATWQAYNAYGGKSLTGAGSAAASKVSYNRPFTTRGSSPDSWLFNAEYPMLRWLEANGYSVSYSAGADTERYGATELARHRVFASIGYDGFWTPTQRARVEAARNAGVHLAFFGGSTAVWQTHWASSIDGSFTTYRTLVNDQQIFAARNALTGTSFSVACCTTNAAIKVPSTFAVEPFWRNTRVADLAPGATATLAAGTLGSRWDEAPADASRPAGLTVLSSTTLNVAQKLQAGTSTYAPGTATHAITLYRHTSGALVFSAGTAQWSWGLDGTHDRGASSPDAAMQQATINLLLDMDVRPASLVSGALDSSSIGTMSALAGGSALAAAAPAGLTIDAVASGDHSNSQTTSTTTPFTTTAGNELLLAFVAGGSSGASVTKVTGAGLTWQLVLRTNAQRGTAEIWRAFAAAPLTNVSVTATLNQSSSASITVASIIGVETSGANGSGAIGATKSASASSGAPKATLTTTRNNSWVFGVGNDRGHATARTVGPNQTKVHEFLTTTGDTYWSQRTTSPTPSAGTSVTINDTAPTGDRYNLSIVEVLPTLTPDTTPPTASMTAPTDGTTVSGPNVPVTASANDNIGVAGVQLTLDGGNLGAEIIAAPYSRAWDSRTVPNGPHSLGAIARDAAGNTTVATSVSVTVTNDTTPPVVTLTAPTAGTAVSGTTVTISADASDDTSVVGVQFLLDGVNFGQEVITPPYQVTWNTTAGPNGNHTVAATGRDPSGHFTTSSATVVVSNPDITAPTVTITAPANNAIVFGSAVTVSGTAADANGVLGVQLQVDGQNVGNEDAGPPYTFGWNSTTAGNGPHTLSLVARDAANNLGTASVNVTVTTSPAIYDVSAGAFTASSAGITWGTNVASTSQVRYGTTAAYGSTTPLDSTLSISHSQTIAGLSNGVLYHYQVVSTDMNGSTVTSPDSTFTPLTGLTFFDEFNGASLDTRTWIALNRHGDFSNSEVQYYLPQNAAVANGLLNITSKVDASVPGYNYTSAMVQWQTMNVLYGTLEIRAKMAGGQGTWPALWLLGYNCQQTNILSADSSPPCHWPDPGSDEIDVAEILDGNLTVVNEAVHSSLGNDNCLPTVSDVSQNWHTYALVWTAGTATWKIDGVTKCTITTAIPSTPLFLMINTASGGRSGPIVNSTFPQTLSVDYVRFYAQDATPPTVAFAAPSSGSTVSGTLVPLTATASDNIGVAGVLFLVDNVAIGAEDTTSPYGVTWNSTTATNGPHTLTAIARDGSGNKTTVNINVTVNNPDVTPPAVSITAPANNASVSGTVTVTATASDANGIGGVQFQVDGMNIGGEDTVAPYSVVWDATAAGNGPHTLRAIARDNPGNTATASVQVTVTVPPVIFDVGAGAFTTSSATINWSTNVPANSQVRYGTTTAYGSSSALNSTQSTSHTQTISGLSNGVLYHFQVVSTDAAGNTVTSPDSTFTPLAGLTFADEFNGTTLDTTTWFAMNRSGDTTNGEVQYYLPQNAAVGSGALNLASKVDASVAGYNYTSAMVQWQSMNISYGTLEIRAKMAGGQGTWPALWLLGYNCHAWTGVLRDPPCSWPTPGSDEIDITEILNGSLTTVNEAVHSSLGSDNCLPATSDVSQNWHTYALVWGAGSATWKIDGVVTCTITTAVPSTPLFLIINTAVGGHSGPIVNGTLPQTLSVDYVRFYAQDATPPTVTLTSPAGGATVSGTTVPLAATAGDNIAVAGVQFALDNNILIGAEDTTSPYGVTWNSTATPNGVHTLKATARDTAGNTTTTSISVTVSNPPSISGIAVSAITQTSAVVSWTTNAPADSQVRYGLTNAYGLTTTRDLNLATSHSQTLTGLTASTTYHFQVVSIDATASTTASTDAVFTTASPAAVTLGTTTKGSTLDSGDSNYLNGSSVTTTGGGPIVSMSVYVGNIDSGTNNQYQLGIYTDAAGKPGTLVASSATGTLTTNAWNTMAVSATFAANTKYWLMYNTNGRTAGVNNMYYSNGAAGKGAYSTGVVTFGTWPATFPSSTITTSVYSIYATFGP